LPDINNLSFLFLSKNDDSNIDAMNNNLSANQFSLIVMNKIEKTYHELLAKYGRQGWWPIINNKTLICEYNVGAPKNEAERFEICIGSILAQNTQFYPNVVRAIQQLKLGRPFTKNELEVIKKAEVIHTEISGKTQKQTPKALFTQNTAWSNVEKALLNLKRKDYISPKKILSMDDDELIKAIRPAGYFNQKAKKVKLFSEFYLKLDGKTLTREQLLSVWGIGPETADSILLYAYNEPVFVVDAYTKRIFSRLKLIKDDDKYEDIQRLFMKNLLQDVKIFNEYHALIVEHAKRHCRIKQDCNRCPITRFCYY